LFGLSEFDIMQGTYNIKIRNYQLARCHVPEGCNLHIHDMITSNVSVQNSTLLTV